MCFHHESMKHPSNLLHFRFSEHQRLCESRWRLGEDCLKKRRGRKVRNILKQLRQQTVQPAMQIPMEKTGCMRPFPYIRRYKGGWPVVLYLPDAQMNELQPKNANIHMFSTTKIVLPQDSTGELHFHNNYVEHISSCCCRWGLAWDPCVKFGKSRETSRKLVPSKYGWSFVDAVTVELHEICPSSRCLFSLRECSSGITFCQVLSHAFAMTLLGCPVGS